MILNQKHTIAACQAFRARADVERCVSRTRRASAMATKTAMMAWMRIRDSAIEVLLLLLDSIAEKTNYLIDCILLIDQHCENYCLNGGECQRGANDFGCDCNQQNNGKRCQLEA